MIETMSNWLEEKGIVLSHRQKEQFQTYASFLTEWNEKMNLTAITEEKEIFIKHFYDSLTLAFFEDFTRPITVCDVGAGAGFPGIPLKICFPSIRLTVVDALKKRITFLEQLIKELSLHDVFLFHDRAESFGQNKSQRESFHLVTARAVAKLSVLSEYCLPLVRVGGSMYAMKGAQVEEELQNSRQALKLLGGEIKQVHRLRLPEEGSLRHIIRIEKIAATPKRYPRKPGTPGKQPLS